MEVKENPTMEEQILETAEQLFLEKGFALTSTTEIARMVGCNQALVHYYFRTKENLFNLIFENKFRLFFKIAFENENEANLSFEEKLTHIIESHFDLVRKNSKLPTLITSEFIRNPNMINSLKNKLGSEAVKVFGNLNTELQAEIKAGRVREITMIDLIFSIISSNIALFLLLPIASKVLSIDVNHIEMIVNHRREENVKMILNGIKP